MGSYFINEAFEKGIIDYLNSKHDEDGKVFNSFLVVVIRLLCSIYGELDIVNPYYTKNVESLKSNMQKYGSPLELIDNLMFLIDMYYKIDIRNQNSINREENIYFIDVQKRIIDLFMYKKNSIYIPKEEFNHFFDLLYTPATRNALRLSFNYLNSSDNYEIAKYYQEKINSQRNIDKPEIEQKELLGFDVYKMFNYKLSDLSMMSNDEIKSLNNSIYDQLGINKDAINKEYLLLNAINGLKNDKVTTGNGYVDILIIMSIIITAIMVILIFAYLIF